MAGSTSSPESNTASSVKSHAPFITITALFFYWGFMTVMNDVLVPFFKESFSLNFFQAVLVQFAFFGAFFITSLVYFIFSRTSGDPINRIGYKRTILIALFICAAGCTLFYPAATAVSYPFFLCALFLLATGVTLLQIAANPYAAILGKPENASSRLNLAQGINSLGTTLAPIAGGLFLYKVFATDGGVTLDAVITPYLIFAGISLFFAAVVSFTHLPAITQSYEDNKDTNDKSHTAWSFPQLRLGMAAIFLYVGAEVAIGSFLVDYITDANVMGCAKSVASIFLAYYWGGAMIGRLCGSIAMCEMEKPERKGIYMIATAIGLMGLVYLLTAIRFEDSQFKLEFFEISQLWPFPILIAICLAAFAIGKGSPSKILTIFSISLIILLAVAAVTTGEIALWAALGAGLFNSIMWSNIFTLAIDGLKEHTSQGSSLLVMMIVGGALFPLLMGWVADKYGIQSAFFVPIISYVYIAYYGWWCSRGATHA